MTVLSMEVIEQLTARTGWVRSLAGQLVRDPHLADDVAQEAALAALQRRGPVKQDRAWLAGVVRHVAANLQRRTGRRAVVERQSAPAEAPAGAADVAALVEQQRLLAEAVLALEAPFRDVVLMRFYEGMPQRDIAQRLQIPVATVNSRLTRALAKLRARLDHVHRGDRAAWVAALAPIALPSTARDLASGAVLMKKKTVAAAAVLAVLGGGLGWIALDGGGAQPAAKPVVPMVVPDVASVDPLPPRTATEAADRVAVESEPEAVPARGLVVRVVNGETEQPAAGAEVRLLGMELLRSPAMLATQRRLQVHGGDALAIPFEVGRRVPLDGDAQCVVADFEDSAQLYARGAGLMGTLRLRSSLLTDGEPATLKLWSVQSARVRVVDGAGEPMVAVPVGLRAIRHGEPWPVGMCKTSAPDGVAELSWFNGMLGREGVSRLEVHLAMPLAETVCHELESSAPGPQELTLSCPEVGTVLVRTSVRGGPAPDGTLVALTEPHNSRVGLGAETSGGTARLWPVGVGMTLQATALLHEGQPSLSGERQGPRRAGETVVFEIASDQRVVKVTGRALASDRQPIADTNLVVGMAGGDAESDGVRAVVTTDAEGRFAHPFAIDPAHTRGRLFEVLVQSRGTEFTQVPLADLAVQTRVDLGDVLVRVEAPLVRGVVVDEAGQPLEGVTVWVVQKSSNTSTGWDHVGEYFVPTTDEEGRFALYGDSDMLAGSQLWLRARTRGALRHEPTPFGPATSHVRLVMRRAGVLEGRLLVDDGVPLQTLDVEVWPESRGAPSPTPSGWTIGSPDHDGSVRINGLEPDSYTAIVTYQGRRELKRITGIAVRPGLNTDRRLSPLDLKGALRVLDVRVSNDRGEPLRANVFGFAGSKRSHQLGWSDRPLLLASTDVVDRLVVECEGYFPARVAPVEGRRHDVVLHRGTPVAVRVTKVPDLEKPYSLQVALDPIEGRTQRFRDRWQPDHATWSSASELELRVPAVGPYRARVTVERDDHGYHASRDVTPQPAPQVQVVEGVTSTVAIELDPAVVQSAVEAMRGRGR